MRKPVEPLIKVMQAFQGDILAACHRLLSYSLSFSLKASAPGLIAVPYFVSVNVPSLVPRKLLSFSLSYVVPFLVP